MSNESKSPRDKRKKLSKMNGLTKFLLRFLLAILILCAVIFVTALVMGRTEIGTKTLWQASEKISGGRLSGEFVAGTLYHGVDLQNVVWKNQAMQVKINHLSGKWHSTFFPTLKLTIQSIWADQVDVQMNATAPPKKPSQPMHLPKRLNLPLEIALKQLSVDRLLWSSAGKAPVVLHDLNMNANLDATSNQIELTRVHIPLGLLQGRFDIQATAPFALTGFISLDKSSVVGKNEGDLGVRADFSGQLAKIKMQLHVTSKKQSMQGDAIFTPFKRNILNILNLTSKNLDVNAFSHRAPQTQLDINVHLQPQSVLANKVAGPVSVVNHLAGEIAAHKIPIQRLFAQVTLDGQTQTISNLDLRFMHQGHVTGKAQWAQKKGNAQLQLQQIDLNLFSKLLRPTQLSGQMNWQHQAGKQSVDLDVKDPNVGLLAQLKLAQGQWQVNDLQMRINQGVMQMRGQMQVNGAQNYQMKTHLTHFDPFDLLSQQKQAQYHLTAKKVDLNGTLSANGTLLNREHHLDFELQNSTYLDLPLMAKAKLVVKDRRLLPSQATLLIAGNRLNLAGALGQVGDQLKIDLNAPDLERIGFGLKGHVLLKGDVRDTLSHPKMDLNYQIADFAWQQQQIGFAQGRVQFSQMPSQPMVLLMNAKQVKLNQVSLNDLTVDLQGTMLKHQFHLTSQGAFHNHAFNLALDGHGRFANDVWQGRLNQLDTTGLATVHLSEPMQLTVANDRVLIGDAQMELEGAKLHLNQLKMQNHQIVTKGQVEGLMLYRFLALQRKLIGSGSGNFPSLVFNAQWDMNLGDRPSGFFRVQRQSGDIAVQSTGETAEIGLTQLEMNGRFAQNRLETHLLAKATHVGELSAYLALPLQKKANQNVSLNLNAPVDGLIQMKVPDLHLVGQLFGPNYLLQGQVALLLNLSGSLAKPKTSGYVHGDQLEATIINQSVYLKEGVVHLALAKNLLRFESVHFKGGDGTLKLTGSIPLDQFNSKLSAQLVADHFQLFGAPDRRLSLSGKANIVSANDQAHFKINGDFSVDQARFNLPEESIPQFGNEVVLVRPGEQANTYRSDKIKAKSAQTSFIPSTNITIDLGKNFLFQGNGASLGLMGRITVMSEPAVPLKAIGNVRVTPGSTYSTFGRKLNIENGFFTFNGPIANPGVNILAMKRNQRVEAGVEVTGTLSSPKIQLVSEPNVSDNDKLSWLLFGHSSDSGFNLGQENAMTSALALLGNVAGSKVESSLGIDEFSIGTSEVGLTDAQVLQVSKALNEYFILGYEQGLETSANAIKLTMNISRFWSIMVYGGTYEGADLTYHNRFDRWFEKNRD